jgi:hypothetical protein
MAVSIRERERERESKFRAKWLKIRNIQQTPFQDKRIVIMLSRWEKNDKWK